MMKTYLKRAFQLSDSGVKGLAKSIWSFFLYYVSFVPPMICVFLFADRLLNGNTGKPVVGTREIRHIILNNQVVNSSRALHSLKHTVPKSHKNIAIHMVDHIRRLGVFPANYALDLDEFIDSNGNSYIDIVELNPILCSMCYVNNSIYADVVPEIGECQRQLMMGAEFCYDAIANPKNYDMLRISNKSYTYTSDNQYALL